MNKIDIFNANAEFFERFNNSLEDTAKDRHDRTRFTVTGLENKVEFAVTNAQGRIKKAEEDAVDRLNKVNGMTNEELISKSVGAGKWMREGADGLGVSALDEFVSVFKPRFSLGAYRASTSPELFPAYLDHGSVMNMPYYTAGYGAKVAVSVLKKEFAVMGGSVGEFKANNWMRSYHDKNTRTDKNNVLHSGTGTPINTLNVSDMAQEVVDRDDITVTSGAVYRVIQELRAEIALLKGNTDE